MAGGGNGSWQNSSLRWRQGVGGYKCCGYLSCFSGLIMPLTVLSSALLVFVRRILNATAAATQLADLRLDIFFFLPQEGDNTSSSGNPFLRTKPPGCLHLETGGS